MNQRNYRIGIDVGGTFTDAVVIDNHTKKIVAKRKIATSHNHQDGVAAGINQIIQVLMDEVNIKAEDVIFISHGTTQATNALLEGDVARIGLIGIGEGKNARQETNLEPINLANDKRLHVYYEFINTIDFSDSFINTAIDRLIEQNAEVIVVSESFSVDDHSREDRVIEIAKERGINVTGGHEISQLFGLKLRTRTAVINGSLIPKMLETSNTTEKVVQDVGIKKPLMIMRADGGVMTINEVRKRPILTMLSGLAAGVAGAIMYEKISDGIFIEIGGTSADISVIKDGKVMIKNAEVGGHKTYLKSVDVRTTAIAGGTMIRYFDEKIQIGPRSSHLAGLEYECFNEIKENDSCVIDLIKPKDEDPQDYLTVDIDNKKLAFTLAGAANFLEHIDADDYSYSHRKDFEKAWISLGNYLGKDGVDVANECMDKACDQLNDIIESLIQEYELDREFLTIYGGGGSAGVFMKHLGTRFDYKTKIVTDAPYISTIGVALAMISETIEKSVVNPSEDEIKKIRAEIIEKMLSMGAIKETIEVTITVDTLNHLLIANAMGSSEMDKKDNAKEISATEALNLAKESVGQQHGLAKEIISNYHVKFIEVEEHITGIFRKLKKKNKYIVVMSQDGIVKLRRKHGNIVYGPKSNIHSILEHITDNFSIFSDAGETIPECILYTGYQTYDYSGLMNTEQLKDIIALDLEMTDEDEMLIFVVTRRG
ncbi:hydantoinase/oxoprolinase family protein [Erysipelothrix urinaevulpis]|uniref:hydantoinase/oxoprolinase family protein n=1 Tax=Erysipelothrix urinaevulpis TaxID=2683717 RepID=UPI001359853A|nr:hydantoinase/oxoprolinase family protein [Erysipelothrix urinaevulpis]